MKISKEELLHIANLSDLKISESEIDKYLENLEDILEYTNVLESASIEELDETIGANDNENVFRKDEIKEFEGRDALLQNAPDLEDDMFRIPKVIN
ncbi:MAG: Asp-tRNA(Asn)/Glu-tRNA(Gln) amidotransferase subunit GatC [Clostridia bacterium]|nr:Asp-tRNA(Asn)/Glu-tRNA(Gln) amidotransferase subunit GatC [Clostridia bacterium]MBR3324926.1 Asp-tRNA(Asn)/Glu-tRNA(Gln) amidotransferase subunit GatC [Clostridia bacterium]